MRHSQRRISIGTLTIALIVSLSLSLCSITSAQGEKATAFDIAIVIDTSGSTRAATGVDVNGNGIVGRKNPKIIINQYGYQENAITDPGDSVLAAEVLAAKRLLATLEPVKTRVAVVSFSGDFLPGTGYLGDQTFLANPATPDASLVQPLTSDFQLAASALERVEKAGSFGGTNMAEGIRLASDELAGLSGSGSAPRNESKKVILFLTNGIPTFPEGSASSSNPGDIGAAISAARVAGRFGIQVHTFAIGKEALRKPYTVKAVAQVSGGRYTRVPDSGKIITILPGIDLSSE